MSKYFDISEKIMVDLLIKDDVFIKQAKEDVGNVIEIYPDYSENRLVYILDDGSEHYADLRKLIDTMNELNYMKWHSQ